VFDGCNKLCATLDNNKQFIVGTKDQLIQTFDGTTQAKSLLIEQDFFRITSINNYIVLIRQMHEGKKQEMDILDITNKNFVHHGSYVGINDIIIEEGNSLILLRSKLGNKDGTTCIRLSEKDTFSKIDHLNKRNLFPLSVTIARQSKLDENYIAGLYKIHGDFF
jgi:hypothetical protein